LTFALYEVLVQLAHGGSLVDWIRANYNAKTVIKYIVFCTIDFAIPLWYLIAMVETYILWFFVVKYGKEELITRFIPLLFLFYIILTMVCVTNDFPWFWKMNFVSCALSWFVLGYYLHGKGFNMVENMSWRCLFVIVILGCFVVLIPVVFTIPVNFSCVGIVFYATALFAIALKYPDNSICRPIAFIGDRLSLNVYVFHVIISRVITYGARLILKVNVSSNWYLWTIPLLTVTMSVLFSFALYRIKKYLRKMGRYD
jgi:hypothetical protein